VKRILPAFVVLSLSLRVLAVARAGYSYTDYYTGDSGDYVDYADYYDYSGPVDDDGGTYFPDTGDTGGIASSDFGFEELHSGGGPRDFGRAEGGCSAARLLGGWGVIAVVGAAMATWLQARRPGGREDVVRG
jgi:hypothetical protein